MKLCFLLVLLIGACFADNEGINWQSINSNFQAGQVLNAVNYLLSTEQLSTSFLRSGLSRFTPAQVNDVAALPGATSGGDLYAALQQMAAQGDQQIAILTDWARIVTDTYNVQIQDNDFNNNDLGQQVVVVGPVPVCDYVFPDISAAQFSRASHDMMMTQESAYIGIFSHQGLLNGQTVIQGEDGNTNVQNNFDVLGRMVMEFAGIEATHARHTAYLAQQNNLPPFPRAVEPAIDAKTTYERSAPFISSCPYDIQQLYTLVDTQAVANTGGGGGLPWQTDVASAIGTALAIAVPAALLVLSLF
jgi:hypothetical protein